MQFRVPQFLDIEDKIFGPFTFKQFGFILGAIAFAYIFWKLLPVYASLPLIIIISGNFLALAFVEINGRKYGDVLESGVKYFLNAKIFVWQKKQAPQNSFSQERLLAQEKDKKEKDKMGNVGNIKNNSLEQILAISRKLDILENPEPKIQTKNLRQEILKEKNGFRV